MIRQHKRTKPPSTAGLLDTELKNWENEHDHTQGHGCAVCEACAEIRYLRGEYHHMRELLKRWLGVFMVDGTERAQHVSEDTSETLREQDGQGS